MENSYGIEAARAQLGEIADHTRMTGEVVRLTRHGRTVAVIGPAEAVRPSQGVEVLLHFPHRDTGSRTYMPAVPREGELLYWEEVNGDDGGVWRVAQVEWSALSSSELSSVDLVLEPANEDTKRLTEK